MAVKEEYEGEGEEEESSKENESKNSKKEIPDKFTSQEIEELDNYAFSKFMKEVAHEAFDKWTAKGRGWRVFYLIEYPFHFLM